MIPSLLGQAMVDPRPEKAFAAVKEITWMIAGLRFLIRGGEDNQRVQVAGKVAGAASPCGVTRSLSSGAVGQQLVFVG